MAENRIEFRYRAGDVASAQRMRFLRSNQLKIMIGIWLASTLFLAAPLAFPQFFPGSPFSSWSLVVEIAIIYAVTMVVIIAVTPYLDFVFNRFWKLPLQFQYNDKQLRVSVVAGKSAGLRLAWSEIQRVEENERVFVVFYGTGNKFFILPKSAFSESAMERFQTVLRRKLSAPRPVIGKADQAAPAAVPPQTAGEKTEPAADAMDEDSADEDMA